MSNKDTAKALITIAKSLLHVAEKPLTPAEMEGLELLGRKLSGLNLNTVALEYVKPAVIRSLYRRGLIFVEYKVRFTDKGLDIVDRM